MCTSCRRERPCRYMRPRRPAAESKGPLLRADTKTRPNSELFNSLGETLPRRTTPAKLTEYQSDPGLAARPSLGEAIPVLTFIWGMSAETGSARSWKGGYHGW